MFHARSGGGKSHRTIPVRGRLKGPNLLNAVGIAAKCFANTPLNLPLPGFSTSHPQAFPSQIVHNQIIFPEYQALERAISLFPFIHNTTFTPFELGSFGHKTEA